MATMHSSTQPVSAIGRLAFALGVLAASGCSSPAVPAAEEAVAADVLGADAAATADVGGDSPAAAAACPGGGGCTCQTDGECASKRCLSDETATRTCARPCDREACPAGWGCGSLDGVALCVPIRAALCEPCLQDSDCGIAGLGGGACVDYGALGGYCGAPCRSHADCGGGFACQSVSRATGGESQQCVRVDGGGQRAECPCSAGAIAAHKSTYCSVAGGLHACRGTRSCGDGGLSLCSAITPSAELCDGVDNDCNGATDEGTCDDGKICTDDTCAGVAGCKNQNNTGSCSDGDACTGGDTCSDGACVGSVDPAACDDGNACSTDSCNKFTGCVHSTAATAGKACDDGDPCTWQDLCAGGVCLPGSATVCNDGNPCTADACGAGGCAFVPATGGVCDDADPCTLADACTAGTCDGTALDCSDGNVCTTDSCAAPGGCSHDAVSGGCDDGNACTENDACAAGGCVGVALVCPSPGSCVTAACSAASGGCGAVQKTDGSLCSDGDACTVADGCVSGDCAGSPADCDDGNFCTEDSCNQKNGCGHVALPGACTDGNACTENDDCSSGVCAGQKLVCNDGKTCTDDVCLPASGCKFSNRTGVCDDGDVCTSGDACVGGLCLAGPTNCNDSNACTADSCVAVTGCAHAALPGQACDLDATACTNDACVGSTCTAGSAKVCNDQKECTTDSCDAPSGLCVATTAADDSGCSDGEPCTVADACTGGSCIGGMPNLCDDLDPCTTDSCDVGVGCKHAANSSGGCNLDNNLCTVDKCSAGTCTAGSSVNCDDGFSCTVDSCDKLTGLCQNVTVTDGTGCDDGNGCTSGDVCTGGVCAGSQPPTVVSTLAGQGTAGATDSASGPSAAFSGPRSLAIDASGVLYVADTGNFKIRRIATDGAVTSLAGGVPGYAEDIGTNARFRSVQSVVVAGTTLYVSDSDLQNIRSIAIGTGATALVAGSAVDASFPAVKVPGSFQDGSAANARFSDPMGLAFAGGSNTLYVADQGNNRIRAIDLGGATVSTLAGSATAGQSDGTLAAATFNKPTGLWLSGDGKKLYVADSGSSVIRAIDLVAGTVSTIAGTGSVGAADGPNLTTASFNGPSGISGDGTTLWIADKLNHRIRAVSATATSTLTGSSSTPFSDGTFSAATFFQPGGILWVSSGLWYVADTKNNRIRKLLDPNASCVP